MIASSATSRVFADAFDADDRHEPPVAVPCHLPHLGEMDELGRAAEQRRTRGVERGRQRDDGRVPARTAPQPGVVLFEDRGLEVSERRAGFDAELVAQDAPRPLVRAQRVGLPARAVEREHQLAPSPLPQRLRRDGLLEIGYELAGLPQCEQRVEAVFDHVAAQLLECARRVRAALDLFETLVGSAAPRRQRVVERGDRGTRVAPLEQRAARGRGVGEPERIEVGAVDREHIGAPLRDQPTVTARTRAERATQAGDVGVDGARRAARRVLRPHRVDQGVDGDGGAVGREQRAQDRPLLRPADREVVAVAPRGQRTEHRVARRVVGRARRFIAPRAACTRRAARRVP